MFAERELCIGCGLATKQQPVYMVYEDDFVSCFLDHDPFNEGHTLILTKKHTEDADELDPDTANAVMRASQLLTKAIKELLNRTALRSVRTAGYSAN